MEYSNYNFINNTKNIYDYAKTLTKWVFFASLVGALGGVVGSLFHKCIDLVTEIRIENTWIIYYLPLGGLIIAGMYQLFKKKGKFDTNRVLESISGDEKVPFVMAPLIFISAGITHFLGGSAGREGAALQLGGSIGYKLGKLFRFKKNDLHIMIMAGMSAVFAALFGTPVAAAVFAIEVACVGVFHHTALLACVVSSFLGYQTALWFNIPPVRFNIIAFSGYTADFVSKCIILAITCAVISILFCLAIKNTEKLMKNITKNRYLHGFLGGLLIVVLTSLLGTYDYNGAGMNIIEEAIAGNAKPEAFILKIIFTSITIAAGFKGGEIVPAFFVGSTFGCLMGNILGIDPGFGAAMGFIALFCGVTNCPIASLLLAIEIFGSEWVIVFALICSISYILSGYTGLYRSQKIVYSKTSDDYIDINVK